MPWTPARQVISTATTISISSLPVWAPAAGEYANISLLTPEQTSGVDPCPAGNCYYTANEGQSAIWNDWNGGAFAPNIGAMGSFILHGGGHYGYFGNEVIRYDIFSRTWSRLNNPSNYGWNKDGWIPFEYAPVSVVNSYGSFPDGAPNPIHTYYNYEFIPPDAGGGTLGSVVFMHRHNSNSYVTDPRYWRFNIATTTWSNGPTTIKYGNSHHLDALIYDSKRKGLWKVSQDDDASSLGVSFVSFVTGVETDVPLNSGNSFSLGLRYGCAMGAYNAARDCLVLFRNVSGHALACVDLSGFTLGVSAFAPAHQITQSDTPHPNIIGGSNYPSTLEYCSYDGNFYSLAYPPTTPRLYKLTVPATLTDPWAWSSEVLVPKAGTTSVAWGGRAADNAMYTRFRFVPALKSFAWTDGIDLQVQAGRPSNFA